MKSQYPLNVYPYRDLLIGPLLALPATVLMTWKDISDMLTGQDLSAACLLLNVFFCIWTFGCFWSSMKRFDFSEDGIEIHTLFDIFTVFHAWTEFSYAYVHTNYRGRHALILSRKEFNARQPRLLFSAFGIALTHFQGAIVIEQGFTRKYIDMILPVIPETIRRIDVPKLF